MSAATPAARAVKNKFKKYPRFGALALSSEFEVGFAIVAITLLIGVHTLTLRGWPLTSTPPHASEPSLSTQRPYTLECEGALPSVRMQREPDAVLARTQHTHSSVSGYARTQRNSNYARKQQSAWGLRNKARRNCCRRTNHKHDATYQILMTPELSPDAKQPSGKAARDIIGFRCAENEAVRFPTNASYGRLLIERGRQSNHKNPKQRMTIL